MARHLLIVKPQIKVSFNREMHPIVLSAAFLKPAKLRESSSDPL